MIRLFHHHAILKVVAGLLLLQLSHLQLLLLLLLLILLPIRLQLRHLFLPIRLQVPLKVLFHAQPILLQLSMHLLPQCPFLRSLLLMQLQLLKQQQQPLQPQRLDHLNLLIHQRLGKQLLRQELQALGRLVLTRTQMPQVRAHHHQLLLQLQRLLATLQHLLQLVQWEKAQ